jgi:hypothetical protein
MTGPDKDQRPGVDFSIPKAIESEKKFLQARNIISGMADTQFRMFYLEYSFALDVYAYGRLKIKDIFLTGKVHKDRQDSLLDLLNENIKGFDNLNNSLLWDEANKQLCIRNSSEHIFAMSSLVLPKDLSKLKVLAKAVVNGDDRYFVKGVSYGIAQELDREEGDFALTELDRLGIRQTFIRVAHLQEDPVDTFLKRWGDPAKPSAALE